MEKNIRLDNNYADMEKMSFKKLFGYSIGDFGGNIAFGTVVGLVTFFYTDYAGVSAGAVAAVLAISRIPDAFSDVVVGLLVERTKSKAGKARPWIKWVMVPLAVSTVLLFCVPTGAGDMTKIVYLFISYNLLNTICFTALNLPYSTLQSLMTRDPIERQKLCGWRMGLAPWGRVVAVAATIPLVTMLGDDQKAWIIVISIWAALSLIPLYLCYAWTEEIVEVAGQKEEKPSVKESLMLCLKNPYWWGVGIIWGVAAAHYGLIGAALPYYCKYIFGDANLYSPIYTVELVIWSIMAFLTPMMVKRWTKRNICLFAMVTSIGAQAVYWLACPESLMGMYIVTIIRSIGFGAYIPCMFAFMSDVVEYTQWRWHKREEGMVFSATGVFYKAFAALMAIAVGAMMESAGYISSTGEDVTQPQAVLDIIPAIYNGGLIAIYIIAAVILVFWKIDKNYDKIMSDLREREKLGIM